MRLRILVGTIALILGLAIYGLGVAAIGASLLPHEIVVEGVFYAIAGVAWVAPAAWLTRWMQAAPPYRPPPAG